MIISWRYSQKVEILEYDLCNSQVLFKCLESGANDYNLEEGKIYAVDFSEEEKVPGIERVIELIEEQYNFYLCD